MKQLIGLLLPILLYACTADPATESTFAEPVPRPVDTATLAGLPKGIPTYPALFEDAINAMIADGRLRESQAYHRLLQIGRYQTVKERTELKLKWGLDSLDASAAEQLGNHRLEDARTAILDSARNHQLMIITEAHTKPEHRVFTRVLLKGLYARGYRHLGLENILPLPEDEAGGMFDTLLHERGYPLITAGSGIYPSEPEYGNVIREAIRLGFAVFSYERNGSSDSERDRQQAERIIAYQKAHPGEKIICHGGWYHAVEEAIEKYPGSGKYWMAYHYKQMTGDDPLTVYQDAMNEKIAEEQRTSPYYDLLQTPENTGKEMPQVLVNDAGKLWSGPQENLPFDIVTVQMPLGEKNGYVSWQNWGMDDGGYTEIDVNTPEIFSAEGLTYPLIVAVRGSGESELATPVYGRQMNGPRYDGRVKLRRGWYRFVYRDQKGKRFEKVVELQ